MKKRIVCVMLCLMMVLGLALTANAAGDADNKAAANARHGVARVFAQGHDGSTWVGSAFGVGTVGQPTDIFITNRHCVLGEDEYGRTDVAKRIYLVVDGNSINIEFTTYAAEVEGTYMALQQTYKLDAEVERMIPCDVLFYSEDYDFAILKANRVVENRVALELADSAKDAVPSDTVYTLGYPGIGDEVLELTDMEYATSVYHDQLGVVDLYTQNMRRSSYVDDMTVTTGVVSRHGVLESENKTKVIQHDAQIYGGNSGGALINSKGQVLGINTWGVESAASLNYALYIDYVKEALDDLDIAYNVGSKPADADPVITDLPAVTTPQEEPKKDNTLVIAIVIVAAVAVVAAVVVVVVLQNNKKKLAAQQAAAQQAAAQAAQAAAVRRAYVRSLAPQHGGMRVPLQGQAILIGRSKMDCAIAFAENSPGVSGRHCSLHWDGSAFVLTDLRSTYGTYLQNGQKLTPGTPYSLQPGASFWLGDKQNVLRLELE